MKRTQSFLVLTIPFLIEAGSPGRAEVLSQYTFGVNGSTPSIYTPTTVASNVSATPIAAHAGAVLDGTNPVTQPASSPYLRTTFTSVVATPAASVAANADVYFTVTASAGFALNLTSLTFDAMRGGAGTPRGYEVRSSADNYAASLGTADLLTARPTFTSISIDLSGAAYQGLSAITFKIFGYSPATGSSVDYDNFTVNGATVPVGAVYTWTGGLNANWDTSSPNWAGAGTVYSDGVSVQFDDSALLLTSINVAAGGVSPLTMAVGNPLKPYTFSGGNITVTNGLSKTGAGLLTFNSTVNAGSVQVDGGTLEVGAGKTLTSPSLTVGASGSLTVPATGGLGSTTALAVNGTVLFSNTTQSLAGLSDAGGTSGVTTLNSTALTVTGTSSYNGKLTGTGTLTKTTGGVLSLGGLLNDYTGGTLVTTGALRINSGAATGTGTVRVEADGKLVLGADTAATVPVTLAGGVTGSTGAGHTLAGDLTVPAGATATLTSSDPLVPATNLDTVLTGALHGSGTLNITAASGQGDANGGGGIRFRNVTTVSDFTGTLAILGGAKLEIRSAGGISNAAGASAALRMTAGATGLTTSMGAFSQINLRTDNDTTYGNNVTVTGTGLVNIFTGSINAGILNHTSSLGTLTIGDQQTLISNSGGTVNGYLLTFNAVQLAGGIAGFSPGNAFTAFGQDVTLGPVSETVAGSGFLKSGVSALTLAAANTYTGPTSINAGTLRLGAAGALPSGTLLTVDGGTVDLNNAGVSNNQTVAALAGAGGIITNSDSANIRTLTVNQTTDSTFSSSINDAVALTKSGAGMLTLAGINTYTGATTVTGGTLRVTGTIDNTSGVTVAAGATLCATGAQTLTLTGAIVNNGTLRISSGATLNAAGAASFVNNGILDLITGTATLPPGFTNGPGGIVLNSGSINVKTVSRTGGSITLTVDSHTGHTYQLQSSASLQGAFSPVGATQTGTTGTALTFTTDTAGALRGFYRVAIDP
ncbi:MAG TPA: autotransporter-associated beta strand repeat-containing protein [Verrucomicrobiales bacterium]|nr:autotransporter-associated beta strand repeat-containing protein [Verrucomicrobiales bacterium]